MSMFKPTKRKIILSLIPFVPVLLMPVFMLEIPFSFPLAEALMSIQLAIMILAYGAILLMAFPLQPILIPLGMWEYHSSLFIAASGPEVSVSGMILTALIYSIVLYVLVSFSQKLKIGERKKYCVECEKEKGRKYCNHCQKETGDLFKINVSDTIKVRESLGLEQRKDGIKKYIKKMFQGYQLSRNIEDHPDGVERHMSIDRENDWYDETVRDNKTGKVFRDVHEPLSNHVSSAQKKRQ